MSDSRLAEFKELVRSRTDIVQLIGETVELTSRKKGAEFIGVCPFCWGTSLLVYPRRQRFQCWHCKTGGDCFAFVMKDRCLDFGEAIQWLAQRDTKSSVEFSRKTN